MFGKISLIFLVCTSHLFGKIDGYSKNIENLFEYISHYSTLPYTLVGTKPISIHYIFHPKMKKNISISIFKKWWMEFDENFNRKEYPRFVFKSQPDGMIYLIHKPHCLQVIQENLEIFQKIMGKIAAPEILEEICQSEYLMESLHHDDRLLGILLGFGASNSVNFYEKQRFIHFMEFSDEFFNSENSEDFIYYKIPNFVVVKSKETENLREKYLCGQKFISKIFFNKNEFNVFMEKLNEI